MSYDPTAKPKKAGEQVVVQDDNNSTRFYAACVNYFLREFVPDAERQGWMGKIDWTYDITMLAHRVIITLTKGKKQLACQVLLDDSYSEEAIRVLAEKSATQLAKALAAEESAKIDLTDMDTKYAVFEEAHDRDAKRQAEIDKGLQEKRAEEARKDKSKACPICGEGGDDWGECPHV